MKKIFRIISCAVVVALLSVALAVLPSGSSLQQDSGKNSGIYFLEKDGLLKSFSSLEENAISPVFKIDVVKRVEDEKVEKKSRSQLFRQTLLSSFESLGLSVSAEPKSIGNNVVITSYQEKNPKIILSDESRQASLFNEAVGNKFGIKISEADIKYLKLATAEERLRQINQRASLFGITITPEMYIQFNEGDRSERIDQVNQFAEKYDVPVNERSIETFVEEYSKFPGVPPL